MALSLAPRQQEGFRGEADLHICLAVGSGQGLYGSIRSTSKTGGSLLSILHEQS